MYQLEDGNTAALNSYLTSQEFLEHSFEYSKLWKQEAVIEYAIKIMEGLVSNEEFNYVFAEFYEDSDDDGHIYTDGFCEALDNWSMGFSPKDELEAEMLYKIAHTTLEGASQTLYDVEWEELFDNLGSTVKRVIANDN